MGIFDSIKNALGKTEQPTEEVRVPSAVLRDAGIDPAGLKACAAGANPARGFGRGPGWRFG